jgi:TPR repeat protein
MQICSNTAASFISNPFSNQSDIERKLKDALWAKNNNNFDYAVEIYEDLVKQDVPEAQYFLAVMLNEGLGIEIDHSRAKILLEKALEQGWLLANVELGKMCYLGLGTAKNFTQARQYFEEVADDSTALLFLGYIYNEGDANISRDEETAIRYFELAGKADNALAFFELAQIFSEKNDDEKSEGYYQKAGELGDSRGLYITGDMYKEKGETALALHCYFRAAELGVDKAWPLAMELEISENIAHARYYNSWNKDLAEFSGRNLTTSKYQVLEQYYQIPHKLRDHFFSGWEKTYDHFRRVAVTTDAKSEIKKDPVAFYNLGMMKLEGRGTEKCLLTGLSFLEEAAQLGDQRAEAQLNKMFEKGYGSSSSEDIVSCYREAANMQEPWAFYRIGKWHSRGLDGFGEEFKKAFGEEFKKDFKKALTYLDKAEAAGMEGAREVVNWICQQGRDDQDKSEPFHLLNHFIEEANKGNPRAHYRLGRCYLYGTLCGPYAVKNDSEQALIHIKKSVELGHKDREKLLDLLLRNRPQSLSNK